MVPLLASCAFDDHSAERAAASQARLAERLSGKVAGPAVNCLPIRHNGDLEVIDSDTILFHEGRTIYRQNTRGGCYPGGSKSNYALVTTSHTGRMCAGDIARTVDLVSGTFGGSCSLNDFVPYR
jgi:hypothetical protein